MVYRLSLSFSQLILLACALFVLFIYEQDKNGELIAFSLVWRRRNEYTPVETAAVPSSARCVRAVCELVSDCIVDSSSSSGSGNVVVLST